MNRQDDKKAMFDIMPADVSSSDDKPSLSRRLINKTLQHAQDAVEVASDNSRNIEGVADAAPDALDHVTHQTKRGVEGVRNTVRDMVSETSEVARQVALAMARTLTIKTFNAGQICLSPDYLLVPQDKVHELVDTARIFMSQSRRFSR